MIKLKKSIKNIFLLKINYMIIIIKILIASLFIIY